MDTAFAKVDYDTAVLQACAVHQSREVVVAGHMFVAAVAVGVHIALLELVDSDMVSSRVLHYWHLVVCLNRWSKDDRSSWTIPAQMDRKAIAGFVSNHYRLDGYQSLCFA